MYVSIAPKYNSTPKLLADVETALRSVSWFLLSSASLSRCSWPTRRKCTVRTARKSWLYANLRGRRSSRGCILHWGTIQASFYFSRCFSRRIGSILGVGTSVVHSIRVFVLTINVCRQNSMIITLRSSIFAHVQLIAWYIGCHRLSVLLWLGCCSTIVS